MRRREFIGRASGMGAALTLGSGFWARALAAPAQPGPSPYGELLPPDANGLMLPEGFTSRVVATSLLPVDGTDHLWLPFPDGGACVPTDDGGWIYLANSENPPPADIPVVTALSEFIGLGGVSAIRFDAAGGIVDAYPVLTGSLSNCAGGLTPWGTWLSCEEWEETGLPYDAGKVWECDPFGVEPAVDRPSLGRFKHEMAAVDTVRRRIYLTEDLPDGLVYRYTPPEGVWGSGAALEGGTMEAMAVAGDGSVTWLPVTGVEAPAAALRTTVPGATAFAGGEGAIYDDGHVYITTKGDDRVWDHDIEAATLTVLYDAAEFPSPLLNGVDNIIVSVSHDLYVAEDGGNLEVCMITPDLVVSPVLRMTGPQHGLDNPTPLPLMSEVTGLAFSPDGNRLYFSSQRGNGLPGVDALTFPGPGITYEVTGPFRGGTLASAPMPPPAPTPTPSPSPAPSAPPVVPAPAGADRLPATGAGVPLPAAAAATAAATALWRLRTRATDPG
ncbi:MAG: alkaline phosphatase PhoX [Acidimicrobiales bacterium]